MAGGEVWRTHCTIVCTEEKGPEYAEPELRRWRLGQQDMITLTCGKKFENTGSIANQIAVCRCAMVIMLFACALLLQE